MESYNAYFVSIVSRSRNPFYAPDTMDMALHAVDLRFRRINKYRILSHDSVLRQIHTDCTIVSGH